MAPDKNAKEKDLVPVQDMTIKMIKRLDALEVSINARFDKLKQIIIDYLSLGSDFAKGSLITALKQV